MLEVEMQSQSGGVLKWIHTNAPIAWIVALLAAITLLIKLRKRLHREKPMKPDLMFEMPNTEKSRAFAARNPQFSAAFARLFETANECFGRNMQPKDHLENICFWLGHTCRQDFLEIVFLAVGGYGAGATKILRSLYERAVTIAYLIQKPEKVERFLQFAAIQEKRAVEATLKQVSQDRIDAAMEPGNTVAEIRKRYEQYKGTFKATTCEVCGIRTPQTWDLDLVSMVGQVGEPYQKVFVLAYTGSNFQIHATLASSSPHDEDREEKDAKTAFIVATELLLAVMRSQNGLFSLGLDADIEARTDELRDAMARDELSTQANRFRLPHG